MFADARRQFQTPVHSKFFGIVQPNDAPPRIQNHRRSDYRTKERTAARFINSSDTLPPALPRNAFVPR